MFSVIIPYYKKRKFIERCIESVLNQTYDAYEIILVDDGSNDDISEICSYKYGNRVRVISQENGGVSVARNMGISQANYDFIAFLDADDFWSPVYLEINASLIEKYKTIKIIGSSYTRKVRDIEDKITDIKFKVVHDYFKNQAQINTLFFTSATIINKEFFKQNIGFNPELKRGEDTDVWFRCVESGGNALYICNTLVYYSDEDQNQATRSMGKLENSLVGQINSLYLHIFQESDNIYFKKFVSKYVYFKLYPFYFSDENHIKAKKCLIQNHRYYFFLHLPYYIPFKLGKRIIKSNTLSKLLRLYLKFVLRYIYKEL